MTDLTPAGQVRKNEMFAALQHRVTARRRRRRAAQISAGSIPLIAVGIILMLQSRPSPHADRPIVARAPGAARVQTVTFERIGDAELLDLLREADRPGGLIRRGQVTSVVFDDPERAAVRPGSG